MTFVGAEAREVEDESVQFILCRAGSMTGPVRRVRSGREYGADTAVTGAAERHSGFFGALKLCRRVEAVGSQLKGVA